MAAIADESFNLTGTGIPNESKDERFQTSSPPRSRSADRPDVYERRGPAGWTTRGSAELRVVATQVRRRQQYRRPVAQPQRRALHSCRRDARAVPVSDQRRRLVGADCFHDSASCQSQPALLAGAGAIETRHEFGTSADGDEHDRISVAATVSTIECGPRRRNFIARAFRRRHQARAADPSGRGQFGPADRVRERCQLITRTRRSQTKRSRCALLSARDAGV